MLLKVVIIVAIVGAVLVIVVALQSSEFRITRSASVNAQPAAVFAQVNDFHQWEHWSPWAKIDANMKQSYEGASAGVGAVYRWSGNSKVGEGRMAIVESRPGELVRIDLQFLRPFRAQNPTEFTFKPDGSGTIVSWTMKGKKNFLVKAVHLFMNMDKMVGGDFERGLAQMKAAAETSAQP